MGMTIGEMIAYKERPLGPSRPQEMPTYQPHHSVASLHDRYRHAPQYAEYQRINYRQQSVSQAKMWLRHVHVDIAAAECLLAEPMQDRGPAWREKLNDRIAYLEDRARQLAGFIHGE